MGAAVARVQEMVDKDRVDILESDVKVIFSDIGEIKGSVKALEVRVEALDRKVDDLEEKVDGVIAALHAFKTEVAKELAAVRIQIGELRAEMIERFGHLKIWVLVTIAGTVASLISMVVSIATFVHGFKSP